MEKEFYFPMIAIVAIVAIVGMVVLVVNSNKGAAPVYMGGAEPVVESAAPWDFEEADELVCDEGILMEEWDEEGNVINTYCADDQDNVVGEAIVGTPTTGTLTCSETDRGMDFYVRGTTCYGSTCKTDYCKYSNYLIEYYCYYGNPKGIKYKCPLGCENGVCKTPPCTDSDRGINYNTKGWVTVTEPSGRTTIMTDTCEYHVGLDPGEPWIYEYYCTTKLARGYTVDIYRCPGDCENGRCLSTETPR